ERSAEDCAQFDRGTLGYLDWMLVGALTFLGRLEEASGTVRQAMAGWRRDGLLRVCSGILAMLLAERGRFDAAARLTGAATAHAERSGIRPFAYPQLAITRAQALLGAASLDPLDVERWLREGAELDEAALAALCMDAAEPE